jgi:hypothetical protein
MEINGVNYVFQYPSNLRIDAAAVEMATKARK